MNPAYHHAAVALRREESVVVCAHVRPDGDAIGSVLAMTLALRAAGVPAVPTLADAAPPPESYAFLPGFALFTDAGDLERPRAFVALDTPNLERLGVARPLAEAADTLVVFDHHPDAEEFGTVNVLNPRAAATGQMVWRFLEALEVPPSPEIALACYVALVTDTGRFAYSNTSPDALRDAASMIENGVDPSETNRYIYESKSRGALELEALAMSRLTVANEGRVAYTYFSTEDLNATGARPDETEGLIDTVRVLAGIEVAILFRLADDGTRVNLRSKTGFDVSSIARAFGGGGHVAAAGFTYDGALETVAAMLLPLLPGGDSAT